MITDKNERKQSNSNYSVIQKFAFIDYKRKLIQCRGRIAIFFFTPPPKDPQTTSRKFHLNRNKLGISMLFLPDFSIILKTVTCALIN